MAYPPSPIGKSAKPGTSSAKRVTTSSLLSQSSSDESIDSRKASIAIRKRKDVKCPPLRICESDSSASSEAAVPPQSVMSLSTEASADQLIDQETEFHEPCSPAAFGNNKQRSEKQQFHYDKNHNPRDKPRSWSYFQRIEDAPRVYMEKLYENTVDGPCQTVTFCELQHMDLFVNCQQPLSFLGFGHNDPRHGVMDSVSVNHSYHNIDEDAPPLPGMYTVPKGCEYCNSSNTDECNSTTCRRPKLFFHKQRPPFASKDSARWDPVTDRAKIPLPISQDEITIKMDPRSMRFRPS